MSDFRVEMLPAREGDCLIVSYRDRAAKRDRHVLIDAGRAGTWPELKERLSQIPANERVFELLVISHIDRDHIEGVLKMLGDDDCPVSFQDIWFNGYHHLIEKDECYGAVQGEKLTTLLLDKKLPWNTAFGRNAVCISTPGSFPEIPLDGGLSLTVLSPDRKKLTDLVPVWEDECEEAGLIPTVEVTEPVEGDEPYGAIDVDNEADSPYKYDTKEANGSSIALLATYGGRKVLLAADAHTDVLGDSLKALGNGKPVALDAWKIGHHGSAGNTTKELLEAASCSRYLVSTSGAYFKHPHRIAIARLLKYGGAKELFFNYRSKYAGDWDDEDLKKEWDYSATYCEDGSPGWVVIPV